MTSPAAKGERFLAVAGDFISILDVANVLRPQLGAAAAKLPRREIPDIVVRLGAIVNPMARQVLPELGKAKNATSEKARRLLGWSPRSREEAILASVESMARLSV